MGDLVLPPKRPSRVDEERGWANIIKAHREFSAIETPYKGHTFRSRLEARWAAFFDEIGWQWNYEPFDLNGYIPDFSLSGFACGPIIVEVKPTEEHIGGAQEKALASGWGGEILIVAESPRNKSSDLPTIGSLSQRKYGDDYWADALLGCSARCCGGTGRCDQYRGLIHESGDWTCYRCGGYHKMWQAEGWKEAWGRAHAATRWTPKTWHP